jgi:hypothetical protein
MRLMIGHQGGKERVLPDINELNTDSDLIILVLSKPMIRWIGEIARLV